jgi:hypothetical protein
VIGVAVCLALVVLAGCGSSTHPGGGMPPAAKDKDKDIGKDKDAKDGRDRGARDKDAKDKDKAERWEGSKDKAKDGGGLMRDTEMTPPLRTPVLDEPRTGTERRRREPDLPAGILTAGSFDDTLFPDFFRKFAGKVGQNPHVGNMPSRFLGQPLEVVVRNRDGFPVGNARVRLAAGQSKVVELITRSDGRAIFHTTWDRLPTDVDLEATVLLQDSMQPIRQAIPRDSRRALVTVSGPTSLPRNLDLTFVVDTTGSMGDELHYLKSEIRSIAAAVRERFPNVQQRYGLAVYRDEGDDYVSRRYEFTSDLERFQQQIAAQSAAGGGDIPEAVHKGLEEATRLEWRTADTARVLFLIGDAPPHGRDAAATLDQVDVLRKKGIAIYGVAASCSDAPATEATEFFFRAASLLTGGQYLFLTDDSGVGDSHGEPHIPHYHVEKLNKLMVRMIAAELAGKRLEPDPKDILRTVGKPIATARQQ